MQFVLVTLAIMLGAVSAWIIFLHLRAPSPQPGKTPYLLLSGLALVLMGLMVYTIYFQ